MEQTNDCDGLQSPSAGTSAEGTSQDSGFPVENKVPPPRNPAKHNVNSRPFEQRRGNPSANLRHPNRGWNGRDSVDTQIIELKNKLKASELENKELSIKNKKLAAAVKTLEKENAFANTKRGQMYDHIGTLKKQVVNLEAIKKRLTDKLDKADHNDTMTIAELEQCNDALCAENEKYSAIINQYDVGNAEAAERINNITKSTEESNAALEELTQRYTTLDARTANLLRKYELEIFQLSTRNMAVITSMQQEKASIYAELQNLIRQLGGDVYMQGEYDGNHGGFGDERNLGDLVSKVMFTVQQLTVKNVNLELELATLISENERVDNAIVDIKNRVKSMVSDQAVLLDDLTQVNESLGKDVRSLFEKIELK